MILSPCFDALCIKMDSAIGLRQMLPRQTNRTDGANEPDGEVILYFGYLLKVTAVPLGEPIVVPCCMANCPFR
jgi:hypothetical protein